MIRHSSCRAFVAENYLHNSTELPFIKKIQFFSDQRRRWRGIIGGGKGRSKSRNVYRGPMVTDNEMRIDCESWGGTRREQ